MWNLKLWYGAKICKVSRHHRPDYDTMFSTRDGIIAKCDRCRVSLIRKPEGWASVTKNLYTRPERRR